MSTFLGTLLIAWVLRPVWADSSWIYIPFTQFISGLGNGRMLGNIGAWVFMIGFVMFAIIGTAWNAYLFRQLRKINKHYARFLAFIFEISMISVALVGIFDGIFPEPWISGLLHIVGALVAFYGHTIAAVLMMIPLAYAYWKAQPEKRQMAHPIKLCVVVVLLSVCLTIYMEISNIRNAITTPDADEIVQFFLTNPFWQWVTMLSLMNLLFWMGRLFPEDLRLD